MQEFHQKNLFLAMKKNNPARRDFIKLSAMALGGVAMAPIASAAAEKPATSPADKKLNIVCVGGHPGDPAARPGRPARPDRPRRRPACDRPGRRQIGRAHV